MTDRKPDFYVVKRTRGRDTQWLCGETYWSVFVWKRHRFATQTDAMSYTAHGGRVVPVFCTSKRAEPKMRERSSAWVLKRLAEGKVLVIKWASTELVHRFLGGTGAIQYFSVAANGWKNSQFVCHDGSGRVFCRIARPSEVPQ